MKVLKTCPFCGGEVSLTYSSSTRVFNIWHTDRKCEFSEPIQIERSELVDSLEKAKKVWNRRIF